MLAVRAMMFAAAFAAAPLLAQAGDTNPSREAAQDRGVDIDTPKHAAVDAQEAPVTRELNAVAGQQAAGDVIAGEVDQKHYRQDMAAFHDALMANKAEAMRDEARFERQQRAYADAMAQWRLQVAACDKGRTRACKLPTPNPADYY